MSAEERQRARRPRGIVVLVGLFYLAAGLVLVSAVATGEELLPTDIATLVVLYLLVLAWGLWRLYRWAWFSTLIMFGLSVPYLLSNAELLNQPIIWPMIFIAISAAYLLWPNVRRVYLNNGYLSPGDGV